MKLNIGCGGKPEKGFDVQLDIIPYDHVNCCIDLENLGQTKLPYPSNSFDEMQMFHVFEHIHNVLPMMEELWRVAKPGCEIHIRTPYGSSNNADEDPTHVRRVFDETFTYFSQCWYGENSYNYLGDWDFIKRIYVLNREYFQDLANENQVLFRVMTLRNVVLEFRALLKAVKPARKAGFAQFPTVSKFKFQAA